MTNPLRDRLVAARARLRARGPVRTDVARAGLRSLDRTLRRLDLGGDPSRPGPRETVCETGVGGLHLRSAAGSLVLDDVLARRLQSILGLALASGDAVLLDPRLACSFLLRQEQRLREDLARCARLKAQIESLPEDDLEATVAVALRRGRLHENLRTLLKMIRVALEGSRGPARRTTAPAA